MSTPTRPLTRDEREAFRLGRLVAAERAPYFMHALFAVSPAAAPVPRRRDRAAHPEAG